jgi:hypothetical protein
MKKSMHVHKYERIKFGDKGFEIYKCQLENCPHYVATKMAVNRLCICWGDCGGAVKLTPEMVNHDKIKRPMCDDCRKLRLERRRAMKELPREGIA